jgi:hypothetical protein
MATITDLSQKADSQGFANDRFNSLSITANLKAKEESTENNSVSTC